MRPRRLIADEQRDVFRGQRRGSAAEAGVPDGPRGVGYGLLADGKRRVVVLPRHDASQAPVDDVVFHVLILLWLHEAPHNAPHVFREPGVDGRALGVRRRDDARRRHAP